MNENALYYTFSTVAQMLATAFGVMLAIVLFHLASVKNNAKTSKTSAKNLKAGFLLTAWTIAVCVIALPLVPMLSVHPIVAISIVAVVALSSLICGFYYYFLAVSQL